MSTTNLVKYFKSNPLITDVGNFFFVAQIGQGGNALVCSFKKDEDVFAIKFIDHGNKNKLARFVDEYFCASQLGTHKNIVHTYHFDSIEVEGKKYSLIIMKHYDASLKGLKNIPLASDEEKASKGWRLARALFAGCSYLHRNGIIHRDIKPENIFFDTAADDYVIGDLGIAHFSEDFVREAYTKEDERLANYLFSPPDQIHPKGPPSPVWDIYAIGQVLSWYLYDMVIRGAGRETYTGENKDLAILDAIIHRCVQNDYTRRFQSIEEIKNFEVDRRTPTRDVFERLRDLDEVVRSSIPKIDKLYETTEQREINRFLTKFSQQCRMDEFWYITSEGGDNTLGAFSQVKDERWLLSDYYELKIQKLIFFKHDGLYKSFFLLLTEADEPFTLSDFDGTTIQRTIQPGWSSDVATFFDDKYMSPNEFNNGYYEQNGEVHRVDFSSAHDRERILIPDAFMIVPDRTGPSRAKWTINRDFIAKIARERTLTLGDLQSYVRDANTQIDPEILSRL